MKTIKQLTLVILMACFSLQVFANGNHVKPEFESLWYRQGILQNLVNLKQQYQTSDKLFSMFLNKHNMAIHADIRFFFDNKQQWAIDSMTIWLGKKNQSYAMLYSEFIKQAPQVEMSASSAMAPPPSVICDNIGFESGTSGSAFSSNWTLESGFACPGTGCNSFTPVSVSSTLPLNDNTSSAYYSVTDNSGSDQYISSTLLPVLRPGGNYSFRLENFENGGHAMRLSRSIYVDASKPYYKYAYAVVLEDPGVDHPMDYKPYFQVTMKDPSSNDIACANYKVVANPDDEDLKENFIYQRVSDMDLYYRTWTEVLIPLDDYVGQTVTIEFIISDCAWGGHMAYAYIDGDCENYTLSSGSCIGSVDPVKSITAPSGFVKYWWTGPGIFGSNAKKSIQAYKTGTYKVEMMGRTGCVGSLSTSITGCAYTAPACSLSVTGLTASSCNGDNNRYAVSGTISLSSADPDVGMIKITVAGITNILFPPFSGSIPFTVPDLMSDGAVKTVTVDYYKDDFMGTPDCSYTNTVNAPSPCFIFSSLCPNCIGGFEPEIGKTYVVSAWVKDNTATATTTTYTNPYIEISFNSGATTLSPMAPSGKIIDGWQRIYSEFTVPVGATEISVALKTSSGTADFDDIRVHPVDGGFMSYVYDPVSLKLVAVLDDNNYATFYEYDEEGTLIRTKKETERGIVTITESRDNNPKR